MKIEITSDQYNQIQEEIIKLEDEFRLNRSTMSGWDLQYYSDTIRILKDICRDEYIDLDKIL